jgi:UDP-N-acetylmuramoyl-L-alanyl-D-glutamate--2,6-diaminopimelate ligase
MMAQRSDSPAAMHLSALLRGLSQLPPGQDPVVTGLTLDSRQLLSGQLFLACRGGQGHGLEYLAQALQQGAAAIAYEPDAAWPETRIRALLGGRRLPMLAVPGLRRRASEIAGRFYREPSAELSLIGVTGTNGKTSCSLFLAQALGATRPCAVIGTLGSGVPPNLTPASHTTPDPISLQARLAELRAAGAEAVSMEVSSHALDQGRVEALRFDTAVLTNLSRDHLDYHGDMNAYAAAKQRLFQHPGLTCAVLNHDDPFGRELLPELAPDVAPVLYGCRPSGPLPSGLAGWVWAEQVVTGPQGLEIRVRSSWGRAELSAGLLGRFNASNLMAVLAVLLRYGLPLEEAAARLAAMPGVPGRMERFGGPGQPTVVVDYAHTPDALEQALKALREHTRGRLLCLFGCGGERDRGKRPLMGALAEEFADQVMLSDDNPRGEDGDAIIAEILDGMRHPERALVERNRGLAIRRAIESSAPEDVVLVAGKGHETTQTSGALVTRFSDRETVAGVLTAGEAGL